MQQHERVSWQSTASRNSIRDRGGGGKGRGSQINNLVLAGQLLLMLHAHWATVLVLAELLWLHAQSALAKLAHM
jgi:hypothetical protein